MVEFRKLRENAGFSIADSAEYLGLSIRHIHRYEGAEISVPIPVRRALEMEARLRKATQAPNPCKFRFIDLFAGIGGMRVGFEGIGGECVFTSEWDKYAQETYRANFSNSDVHIFAGDITPYGQNPSLIPPHDVLIAGFPCQPFSIAGVSKKNSLGRKHGFECETQGNLFFDIERIIAHHRPAAFLLENVKNLERHDQGRTFMIIRDRLENALGYKIQWRIISSRPWVPQKRERIFIVGFREEVGFDFAKFDDLIPEQAMWPTLSNILHPHNEVDSKYTLTDHLWKYLQAYKAKHERNGNGFGYSLFGPQDVARTLSARYHKDGSEILIAQPTPRPRRLTPNECARLMGFEYGNRQWISPVSDTQAYRQFGNAVVVPIVEAVAKFMSPFIERTLLNERNDVKKLAA
ncbi:MAG: DNA (cytosine-5-)-methyltransferase [Alphaproteobacteria bacterium]|nr:DNA (cytosine-5-)-methyltransferase [Alphaproteobacteria bacterium]MDE2341438.1 DNA (cytosine-5-)-methyltransferase [Alphaproteobacteria bacterium]